MREIKFRAWDTDKKMFIKSYDQKLADVYGIPLGSSINSAVFDIGILYKTLEQYTGLKDKNGKESYWNDKVKTREGIGIIKDWNGNTWIEGIDWTGIILLSDRNVEFEIIGNIHENPELLN